MDSSCQENMAIFYNIFSAVHYVNTICKIVSQVKDFVLATDLNYWIKHPFEFSDPILKPEYL